MSVGCSLRSPSLSLLLQLLPPPPNWFSYVRVASSSLYLPTITATTLLSTRRFPIVSCVMLFSLSLSHSLLLAPASLSPSHSHLCTTVTYSRSSLLYLSKFPLFYSTLSPSSTSSSSRSSSSILAYRHQTTNNQPTITYIEDVDFFLLAGSNCMYIRIILSFE